MISPYITKKIQELQENIVNGRRRMILLTWRTGEKLRIFVHKDKMLLHILKLQEYYISYHKRPFEIQTVVILEEVTKTILINAISK